MLFFLSKVFINFLTFNAQIKLRSPQTNSAFQKIFNLPPEEFLINDFTCQLKRKLPLQVLSMSCLFCLLANVNI